MAGLVFALAAAVKMILQLPHIYANSCAYVFLERSLSEVVTVLMEENQSEWIYFQGKQFCFT